MEPFVCAEEERECTLRRKEEKAWVASCGRVPFPSILSTWAGLGGEQVNTQKRNECEGSH